MILRRLLVENLYGHAWRQIGFEKSPRIMSPIKENNTLLDIEKIDFYQSGGAVSHGIEIQDLVVYNGIIEPSNSFDKNEEGKKQPLNLANFLKETCFIIEGKEISRRVLIYFVANKAGGVHFDNKLGDEELFHLLDKLETISANRDSIYYEILSIAQLLINSSDTDRFIKRAKLNLQSN